MNPLLDFSGLPHFTEIKPEHITPAIEELLQQNRALIEKLLTDAPAPTWSAFAQPLEDANERLGRAWSQVSHLNAVVNNAELRAAYNANLPKITQYYAELSQNLRLFEKYQQLKASAAFMLLNPAQKKIIENELRDFKLGGAELPQEQKARFMAIQEELASLSAKFEENILDTTNAFALYIESKPELEGLPDDMLQAAMEAAQRDGKSGWKLTLHAPSYLPVMQYGENRALREQIYRAYATRASEFGKAEWDNTTLINKIVALRNEAAHMLGFNNYAEVSLARVA